MASLNFLAEQVKNIIGKGDIQSLIASVIDCYGACVKREFYENKQDGIAEIDGVFVYTFGKDTPLVPILDLSTDQYYIVIPSSYIRLPHEMGINSVSFMKGQNAPFVRITNIGIWDNLKSAVFGGRQTYMVEGVRMFFPKMTNTTNGNILLKMSIALDNVDVDEELNIPPNVANMIVDMVVAKYMPKPAEKPETL